MSITIRLARVGKKNQPFYRIVVMHTKSKRNGKEVDRIGIYNPSTKPASFKIDQAKVKEWVNKGALISDGLRKLMPKSK